MFVSGKSTISPGPPSSSEARAAPESHAARAEKGKAAQSELEEGEIPSEDEEEEEEEEGVKDDDQIATSNVSCAVSHDDGDGAGDQGGETSTPYDQNLTNKVDRPSTSTSSH